MPRGEHPTETCAPQLRPGDPLDQRVSQAEEPTGFLSRRARGGANPRVQGDLQGRDELGAKGGFL